jgi:tRNA pseudouridine55 synthase
MTFGRDDLVDATRSFLGDVHQVPPMVSARKVAGTRLHVLARAGIEVEREARPVRIDTIAVEDFTPGPRPEATVLVDCGSGTYIRSLAADLGVALGGCAHVVSLRRLRSGSFTVDEAHSMDDIGDDPEGAMLQVRDALRDLEAVEVDDDSARGVGFGRRVPALPVTGPGPYVLVDGAGNALAVATLDDAAFTPLVVLTGA